MRQNSFCDWKKHLAIGLSLVFVAAIPLSFSACEKVEDYMPEAYGEWEGNYVYKGNGRSKTTGEEYEKLVESVTVADTTMYAVDCIDYEIIGDEIYMALYLSVGESARDSYIANALVKYDVKEKTQTLIKYFSPSKSGGTESMTLNEPVEIDKIVCVTDTEIIVCTSKWNSSSYSYKHVYVGVNFDGSLSENIYSDLYGKPYYGDKYFIQGTGEEIRYRTWENAEYKTVLTVPDGASVTYHYLEKGDREGLLIYAYRKQYFETKGGTAYVYDGVWFYDFVTGESFSLTDGIESMEAARVWEGGDYFIAYEYDTVTYYEQKGCISKVEKSVFSPVRCVLYEISYGETVAATPVCVFDERLSFTNSFTVTADKIYFCAGGFESAKWIFKSGGYKDYYYVFDRETKVLKKSTPEAYVSADKTSVEELGKIYAVSCGEYSYYLKIHTLQLGIWAGTKQVLTLMRVNPDGTEEAIQFGESGSIQLEGAKYCQDMWGDNAHKEEYHENIRDFIVRAY
ncbi:MAG: hypothetical protein IJX87_06915 [Clostridia bacterium]|nr:hypothetical protein [Clostridia bacterium]